MAFLFHKHYTVEEARTLIPQLRAWLAELGQLRSSLKQLDDTSPRCSRAALTSAANPSTPKYG